MMFTENLTHHLVSYSLSGKSNSNAESHISLEITVLHLAIICNQSSIVSTVLQYLNSGEGNDDIIKKVLVAKTNVVFTENMSAWCILHSPEEEYNTYKQNVIECLVIS